MKTLLLSLGMLGGVLLCAAGIVVVLVTGLDPLWSSAGLAAGTVGVALAWSCRRMEGASRDSSGTERSVQQPLPGAEHKARKGPSGKRL